MSSAPARGLREGGSGDGWHPLAERVAAQARDFLDGVAALANGQGGDLGIDAGHSDGGVGGGPINCTPGGPNDDVDGDGFTPAMGDCDDCDPNVNPNAVEVPTPPGGVAKDENCNGMIDEVLPTCDDTLAVDEMDPLTAAWDVFGRCCGCRLRLMKEAT